MLKCAQASCIWMDDSLAELQATELKCMLFILNMAFSFLLTQILLAGDSPSKKTVSYEYISGNVLTTYKMWQFPLSMLQTLNFEY